MLANDNSSAKMDFGAKINGIGYGKGTSQEVEAMIFNNPNLLNNSDDQFFVNFLGQCAIKDLNQ